MDHSMDMLENVNWDAVLNNTPTTPNFYSYTYDFDPTSSSCSSLSPLSLSLANYLWAPESDWSVPGNMSTASYPSPDYLGDHTPRPLALPSPMMSLSRGDSPAGSPSTTFCISAACLSCRSKHLKCDGKAPCGRCRSTDNECKYVASRRGFKGPQRTSISVSPTTDSTKSTTSTVTSSSSSKRVRRSEPSARSRRTGTTSRKAATLTTTSTSTPTMATTTPPSIHSITPEWDALFQSTAASLIKASKDNFADQCIDAFYRQFYPTRAFIPSKPILLLLSSQPAIRPLVCAVRWIGWLHLSPTSTPVMSGQAFFDEAYALAYDPLYPQSGWLVQALLLLALGLELMCKREKARAALAYAEALAWQMMHVAQPLGSYVEVETNLLDASWTKTCRALGETRGVLRVKSDGGSGQQQWIEQAWADGLGERPRVGL